mgnify:CR=1 FL=1
MIPGFSPVIGFISGEFLRFERVGITERSAHKIINDLEVESYSTKTKFGRKNHYNIYPDVPLKDEANDSAAGELLIIFGWKRRKRKAKSLIYIIVCSVL